MRKIAIAAAVLFALMPGIAAAQQILPKNSVWGRLGVTASGPAQAIPFATLFANAGLAAGPQSCASHNWVSSLLASGTLVCTQPSFADLTSTIAAAQLIAPTASTLGGVQSKDCSSGGQFLQKINTDGTITCATPAGGGNVTGPVSSTSTAVALYNGTAGTSIQNSVVTIDGSGNMAGMASVAGAVLATKAQQQTGSNTGNIVAPATQQNHDSALKAWAFATVSAGVVTNAASYNVTSITRTSAGIFTVNFNTSFASTNYACTTDATGGVGTAFTANAGAHTRSVGAISVDTNQATGFANADPLNFSITCAGRQ